MKTYTVNEYSTAQEIFDFVAHHLLLQAWPSFKAGSDMCSFRGAKTRQGRRMCAAGCLIPHKFYNAELEDNDIEYLINEAIHYLKKESHMAGLGPGSAKYFASWEPWTELITDLLLVHDSFYRAFEDYALAFVIVCSAKKQRVMREFWLQELAKVAKTHKLQYELEKVRDYFDNAHPL
jgi:hypothetical protein